MYCSYCTASLVYIQGRQSGIFIYFSCRFLIVSLYAPISWIICPSIYWGNTSGLIHCVTVFISRDLSSLSCSSIMFVFSLSRPAGSASLPCRADNLRCTPGAHLLSAAGPLGCFTKAFLEWQIQPEENDGLITKSPPCVTVILAFTHRRKHIILMQWRWWQRWWNKCRANYCCVLCADTQATFPIRSTNQATNLKFTG